MPSQIKVDQIAGATGSTVTLPSGQTLDLSSGTTILPSSALSALNATNLTTGTLPNARLSGITADKLDLISTASVPSVTAKGTPSVTDGYIQLNCEQNSHGIKIKSPPHSAGASYTLVMPSAIGTSLQELRMNSGATALEFATPAVVSSDFVKLATATASASSFITFNGYFSSTYDTYQLIGYDVQMSVSGKLGIQLAYGGSYTYVTSDYSHLTQGGFTNFSTYSGDWSDGTNGDSEWEIRFDQGNDANITASYDYKFHNFNSTSTTYKSFLGMKNSQNSTWNISNKMSSGYNTNGTLTSNAITGLRLFNVSGTITKGKFVLYGLKRNIINMKNLVITPENPQGILVDLTSEEIAQREQKVIKSEQDRIAFEAKQQAKIDAKASALAKLQALGLTEEEVKAIL